MKSINKKSTRKNTKIKDMDTGTDGIRVDIGIENKALSEIAHLLNILLAHEYSLYTKTLKFHWNVRGKHFGALHKLFNDQYEQLFAIIDRVAERVRALGEFSLGTLEEFKEHTKIKEESGKNPADLEMIKLLMLDHELVIRLIRKYSKDVDSAKDEGTMNMLGDIIETHEKMAWMLRSHLE